MSAVSVCAHGKSASAPAVTRDYKVLAGQESVGCPDNTVNCTLACAIAVVKKVFCLGIVHCDDRKFQYLIGGHAAQPDDARCSLFCASNQICREIRPILMNGGNKVCAVIHRDGR